jgi:hypothetical protein
VACAGIQIESIEFFQVLDALEAFRAKGTFAIEGVKHDSLEQIAERHVVILAESFQDFQYPFFHANAGLHALDHELFFFRHGGLSHFSYQCTKVPGSLQQAGYWRGVRSAADEKQNNGESATRVVAIARARIRWRIALSTA